jgi:hypothetical protein
MTLLIQSWNYVNFKTKIESWNFGTTNHVESLHHFCIYESGIL